MRTVVCCVQPAGRYYRNDDPAWPRALTVTIRQARYDAVHHWVRQQILAVTWGTPYGDLVFIPGKQKRVPRARLIDGMPIDDFVVRTISRNGELGESALIELIEADVRRAGGRSRRRAPARYLGRNSLRHNALASRMALFGTLSGGSHHAALFFKASGDPVYAECHRRSCPASGPGIRTSIRVAGADRLHRGHRWQRLRAPCAMPSKCPVWRTAPARSLIGAQSEWSR